MKSPLVYLTVAKLKNQLKEAVKHPAKLIYVLFLGAMLVLSTVGGKANEGSISARPLYELTAIMVLFYSMMFLITFMNGVNGGAGNFPLFTLSDVGMLFPSPLRPNKVLFYGLLRQLGLSLLLGFFLLFQYSWLHAAYGMEYGHLLLIVVGYGLCLFLGQVCAMAAYVRTSGDDGARRWVRYCVYIVTVGFVALLLLNCRDSIMRSDIEGTISAAAGFLSKTGVFFPVSGWAAGLIGGLLAGEYTTVIICAALMLAAFGICLLLVVKNKNNYYEDVLQSAEVAQSAITAKREGQPAEVTPNKVRLGKIGVGRGWGSNALFYKHLLENRRSGALVFSKMSIIFMLIIIGVSFIYKMLLVDEDGGNMPAFIAVFAMSTYMQLFSESLGRFNWELSKPYIYLMPEPPFKKLLWATAETLMADCIEAVVIFVPVSFILGIGPVPAVMCVLARISFSLLFTAGNIMVERIFGTVRSKGLMLFFYIISLMLLSVPGLGLGFVIGNTEMLPGITGTLLGIIICNVPIALLIMFLCRNLLQHAELNGK
mgnify:CR=1 FL=1